MIRIQGVVVVGLGHLVVASRKQTGFAEDTDIAARATSGRRRCFGLLVLLSTTPQQQCTDQHRKQGEQNRDDNSCHRTA
jgi:hypothetical protein